MHKLYDEDDELRKEFKDTFSGIHASEDLKARTLTAMLDDEEIRSKETKGRLSPVKKIWIISVPAAALICAALVLMVLKGTPAPSYITQLENGVFCEEVKLGDGELHFVADWVVISITPNAGGVTIGQMQDGELLVPEDGDQVLEQKENDGGGLLIYKKTAAIKFPDIGEKNWSYIGEQKIYITVLNTVDSRYQAVFEKDGQAYEVTGIGVWQKEFIDYLYRIVKK
ncbi:MAG: hypothetical protein HDR20_03625 [Lachnospiraceae bacterium]|nr:hypothetical protein [Lachnospiraceae bacterium]